LKREILINGSQRETRVAILEDDLVAEIFVERERHRGVVGNVYKGRVSKVLPGMQSSFIDLGLERDGFLYVAEVVDTLEEFERLEGWPVVFGKREAARDVAPHVHHVGAFGELFRIEVTKSREGALGHEQSYPGFVASGNSDIASPTV